MRKATRIVCRMFPLIRQEHDRNRTEDESLCRTAKKKKDLKKDLLAAPRCKFFMFT